MELPWLDRLINLLLCASVLGTMAVIALILTTTRLWNRVMSTASVLYVYFYVWQVQHPLLWLIPPAMFAVGVYVALSRFTLGPWPRWIAAMAASALWFKIVFWMLLEWAVYYCVSCQTRQGP